MNWLAQLISTVLYYLLKKLGNDIAENQKNEAIIKEEGDRAEAASNEAVSELQTPQGQSNPNPEEVPSVKKWSDFFKHRRNRKRL